ncbi:hypothetical protein F5Y00DRAFT_224935 [Daldinia vernicosa]|uniref:uncharacterized protein n=1 Tax=Daldinia vernicosa TaxID=114800 RepID=UPI0020078A23|nr:uncharacterized protein F5Y00DRAFT_224935 [Daldinia vernicosa]KAI0853549.1 hypothetical protein F5Y00DRAFT_224935 [Daldinia vernicosa]
MGVLQHSVVDMLFIQYQNIKSRLNTSSTDTRLSCVAPVPTSSTHDLPHGTPTPSTNFDRRPDEVTAGFDEQSLRNSVWHNVCSSGRCGSQHDYCGTGSAYCVWYWLSEGLWYV